MIFNDSMPCITITNNQPVKSLSVNENHVAIKNGKGKIRVARDQKPLVIRVEKEDSVYLIPIKSRNSFNYLYDVILTLGLASLIEGDHPKRYYYQKNIHLDQKDGKMNIRRFAPEPKGRLQIDFSMPYINDMYSRTTTGYTHDPGFLGIGTGLDYFYKENKSVSLHVGVAIDNDIPFPVGVEYFGDYKVEHAYNLFAAARNNHTIQNFTLGYGLNVSKFYWKQFHNRGTTSMSEAEKHTTAAGLSFITNYRITKNFRVGLLYQPCFVLFDHGVKTGYQHLASLQMVFKFKNR